MLSAYAYTGDIDFATTIILASLHIPYYFCYSFFVRQSALVLDPFVVVVFVFFFSFLFSFHFIHTKIKYENSF